MKRTFLEALKVQKKDLQEQRAKVNEGCKFSEFEFLSAFPEVSYSEGKEEWLAEKLGIRISAILGEIEKQFALLDKELENVDVLLEKKQT